MGFLFHVIRFPTAITGAFILNLWSHLKFFAIGALTHLGLYKPPPDESDDSGDTSNNYIFIFDGTSCPIPVPINVVTAAIKSKLPVVQFQEFEADIIQKASLCTICLEPIHRTDGIRKLCRCSHVFHRDCLDAWADSGQVTCPLCRSMLLPPKTILTRSGCGGGGGGGGSSGVGDPPPTAVEGSGPPPLITTS